MSGMNRNEKVAAATAIAQERARKAAVIASSRAQEAAARVRPAAAQVKPLARSTQDAAQRGLIRTRIWAAPRIEHTGQVLQDSVAPRVADMLSSAAQRIEPEKPRSRNWWTLSGVAILLAAAAAAAAAALRKRSSARRTIPEAEADTTGESPEAPQASTSPDASRAGRTS
jgi:hypothetical protein